MKKLIHIAKDCNFGTVKDSLIRDRIVCGIIDNAVRERLLREPDLNLDKAIQICQSRSIPKSQHLVLLGESEDL